MRAFLESVGAGAAYDDAGTWFWGTALVFATSFIITSLLPFLDRRRIAGESVWAKPLKFELSLFIHFLTLALLTERLSETYREGNFLLITAIVAAGSAIFEIVYIMFRASRQEASHFNTKTPLAGFMYGLMAVCAVILTAAAAGLALVIMVDADFNGGGGLRWGAVSGLFCGTVLTMITAFVIGGAFSHHVGDEPEGAPPNAGHGMVPVSRRPPPGRFRSNPHDAGVARCRIPGESIAFSSS